MDKAQFLTRFHHAKQINSEADFPLKEQGKPAAVLLPIMEYNHELTVLFTVRARHLKHHAGQVSFPGGKQESYDSSLVLSLIHIRRSRRSSLLRPSRSTYH